MTSSITIFQRYVHLLYEAKCPPHDSSPAALSAKLSEETAEFEADFLKHGFNKMNTMAELADVLFFIHHILESLTEEQVEYFLLCARTKYAAPKTHPYGGDLDAY